MIFNELKKDIIEIKNIAKEIGFKFYHFILLGIILIACNYGLWQLIGLIIKFYQKYI